MAVHLEVCGGLYNRRRFTLQLAEELLSALTIGAEGPSPNAQGWSGLTLRDHKRTANGLPVRPPKNSSSGLDAQCVTEICHLALLKGGSTKSSNLGSWISILLGSTAGGLSRK